MRNPRTRSGENKYTLTQTFSLCISLSLCRSVLRCSPFREVTKKERKREREMRGLICEGVESGSFQMDFKRKARRADDDEESETRCFFSQILVISINSSSSTTYVFDRRFTTKTCEGANMANHLCYPGARYRYTLVLLDFYVLHGV